MGNNLHRNVIFRDGAQQAGQVVPYTTQEPIGSTDPLDLYKYLEDYEAKTGGRNLKTARKLRDETNRIWKDTEAKLKPLLSDQQMKDLAEARKEVRALMRNAA